MGVHRGHARGRELVPPFTAKQIEAIDIGRLGEDACIVAGPGSGKTTVLVERYRQLVLHSGIEPQAILAITFTEKAASNMKKRLGGDPELERLLETAWVSTVHGFCLRLIRENALAAGVDPNVSILQEGQGALLQRRCLTEALDALLHEEPDRAHSLMESLANAQPALLGVYDAIRSSGMSIQDLCTLPAPVCAASVPLIRELIESIRYARTNTRKQRDKLDHIVSWGESLSEWPDCRRTLEYIEELRFARHGSDSFNQAALQLQELIAALTKATVTAYYAGERATLIAILQAFERRYDAAKRERNVLDFSDLERCAVRLLETQPDIQARTRRQFRQILMDEFQDTNGQQARLLNLLRAPDAFYAVGDINQSIFGFRHASPDVFRQYRDQVRDAGKHHVELVENWRSRPEILLAAETILNGAEGIEHRRLQPGRRFAAKKQPSVEVIVAQVESGEWDFTLEPRWVARRIRDLHNKLMVEVKGKQRPAQYCDFTVLVRNSIVYQDFAAAFEAEKIPYEQSRRKGFFDTREAVDLIYLLRAIANPRDEIATAGVLRSPFVGLSDEALLRLELILPNIADALDHLDEGAFSEADRGRLDWFRSHLRQWREEQPYIPLDRLLTRAIHESGYPWDPRSSSGANIEKFLEVVRTTEGTLAEFLEETELLRESDKAEAEAPVENDRDVVRMMTAHSAKGLEFPVVIIAAMHKGVDTSRGSFSFTPEFGLGASWIHPITGKPIEDSIYSANKDLNDDRERQEAHRLLYVALTRAEEHLILSYTRQKKTVEWAELVAPVFVQECPADSVGREVTVTAPGGEVFRASVLCAAVPPPMAQQSLSFDAAPDLAVLPKPVITGQHDSAVTVTAVALFARDPEAWYRERYLGWQAGSRKRLADIEEEEFESDPKLAASELGSQVHALLAGLPVEQPDARAVAMAETFRRSDIGQRLTRATRTEREFGFLMEVAGIVVRGQIDLWFEEAGELVLVDYKTDDIAREEAADRALDYAMQIHLYALMLHRLTGRSVSLAAIHFLRCNEAVRISPDPAAAENAVAAMTRAQEDFR